MYKKYLTTKSIKLLNSFKKYKNILTSVIRMAEKNYFSNKLIQAKDSMAKTWKIFNSMTNINHVNDDAVWYRQPSGQPTNTIMLNLN